MIIISKSWREYLQDMCLSTVFFTTAIRQKRLTEWELHVDAYKALKAHLVLPSLPGTERIDFVAGHLDILDRKLGSLLAFHGMLATGLYLTAMAWVPWGNLGDKQTIHTAEKEQIQALIKTVITRTAFFRLAVPLTVIWLLLFAYAAWTTKTGTTDRLNSHPPPNVGANNAADSELLGNNLAAQTFG
jgi:hypothetical protein